MGKIKAPTSYSPSRPWSCSPDLPDLSVHEPQYADFFQPKLFNKWSLQDVDVSDISLVDYIGVKEKHSKYLPHTAGRYQVQLEFSARIRSRLGDLLLFLSSLFF